MVVLLGILILLVGIKIGSSNNVNSISNDLFEQAKDQFEEEIKMPNNEYENIELKPKEYLPNKIAKKVNNIIEKIINKLA